MIIYHVLYIKITCKDVNLSVYFIHSYFTRLNDLLLCLHAVILLFLNVKNITMLSSSSILFSALAQKFSVTIIWLLHVCVVWTRKGVPSWVTPVNSYESSFTPHGIELSTSLPWVLCARCLKLQR